MEDYPNSDNYSLNIPNYSLCFSGGGVRSAFFNLGTLEAFSDRLFQNNIPSFISSVSGGGYVASSITSYALQKNPTDPPTPLIGDTFKNAIKETRKKMTKTPEPHDLSLTKLVSTLVLSCLVSVYNPVFLFFVGILWQLVYCTIYFQYILQCLEDDSFEPVYDFISSHYMVLLLIIIIPIIIGIPLLMFYRIAIMYIGNQENDNNQVPMAFTWICRVLLSIFISCIIFIILQFSSVIITIAAISWGLLYDNIRDEINAISVLELLGLTGISSISEVYVVYENYVKNIQGITKKVKKQVDIYGVTKLTVLVIVIGILSFILLEILLYGRILLWCVTYYGCKLVDKDLYPKTCAENIALSFAHNINIFFGFSIAFIFILFTFQAVFQNLLHKLYKTNITNAWFNKNYSDKKIIENTDFPTQLINITSCGVNSTVQNIVFPFNCNENNKFLKKKLQKYNKTSDKKEKLENIDLSTAMAISGAAAAPDFGRALPGNLRFTRGIIRSLLGILNLGMGKWVQKKSKLIILKQIVGITLASVIPIIIPMFVFFALTFNWFGPNSYICGIICIIVSIICVSIFLIYRPIIIPSTMSWFVMGLGLNQENMNSLYLSDGGHFENLGLLGLLEALHFLEETDPSDHTIFCFDASEDPECKMNGLLHALEEAKGNFIDDYELGNNQTINCDPKNIFSSLCDAGYRESNERVLLFKLTTKKRTINVFYVKAALLKETPPNETLLSIYAAEDNSFPHTSTLNQWLGYSYNQYIKLGRETSLRLINQYFESNV